MYTIRKIVGIKKQPNWCNTFNACLTQSCLTRLFTNCYTIKHAQPGSVTQSLRTMKECVTYTHIPDYLQIIATLQDTRNYVRWSKGVQILGRKQTCNTIQKSLYNRIVRKQKSLIVPHWRLPVYIGHQTQWTILCHLRERYFSEKNGKLLDSEIILHLLLLESKSSWPKQNY